MFLKKINFHQIAKEKKTILVRVEEDQAAYSTKNLSKTIKIIKDLIKEFENENILVLGRYGTQIQFLNRTFGKRIKILKKVVDGKELLSNVDVFVGSGGTMTAEAALLGVPTISYNAIPNFIESYLVKKKLVNRETNPKQIVKSIKKILSSSNIEHKKRAKTALNSMEDPYSKLLKAIRSSV